jgi:hypothetical protein
MTRRASALAIALVLWGGAVMPVTGHDQDAGAEASLPGSRGTLRQSIMRWFAELERHQL